MRAERSARFVPDAILYACSLCFFFRVQHHLGQTDKKKERIFHLLLCPIHRSSSFFHILYLMAYGICDLSTPLKKKKKREEKERERSSSQKNQTEKFFFLSSCSLLRETPPVVPRTAREHTHTERQREREKEKERERNAGAL